MNRPTCNVNLYHATSNFKQSSLELVYLAIEIHQIVEKISRSLKKRDWALGYTCYVNCKDDKYEEIIQQKYMYFVVKKSQKKISTK